MMCAMLLWTNSVARFFHVLMQKLWVVGIQCNELKKPDFKNCSLEYIKTFISHTL